MDDKGLMGKCSEERGNRPLAEWGRRAMTANVIYTKRKSLSPSFSPMVLSYKVDRSVLFIPSQWHLYFFVQCPAYFPRHCP